MASMKDLDKYEKLKRFQDYRFCKVERHASAVYLNAIRKDDKKTMDSFERFGNDLHHIISNYRTNEKNNEFGFGELDFGDYGWIKEGRPKSTSLVVIDKIPLSNEVESFVFPNGRFCYRNSFSTSTSGAHCGGSYWGETYDSEKECLIAGLNRMISFHQHEFDGMINEPDSDNDDEEFKTPKVSARQAYCKKIIKLAKKAIQDLKTPQTELF